MKFLLLFYDASLHFCPVNAVKRLKKSGGGGTRKYLSWNKQQRTVQSSEHRISHAKTRQVTDSEDIDLTN